MIYGKNENESPREVLTRLLYTLPRGAVVFCKEEIGGTDEPQSPKDKIRLTVILVCNREDLGSDG
jgi:hypothetical protein